MRPRKSVEADDLIFVLIDPVAHTSFRTGEQTVGVVDFGYCRPDEWDDISLKAKEVGLVPVHVEADSLTRFKGDDLEVLPALPNRIRVRANPDYEPYEAGAGYYEGAV